MKAALALVAPAILLGACSIYGVDCTTDVRPAISVSVVDATTGEPITSGAGMAIATIGALADTVHFSAGQRAGSTAPLAYEREGTYTVDVLMEGYAPWREEGVRVRANECHVETVEITARVEPL